MQTPDLTDAVYVRAYKEIPPTGAMADDEPERRAKWEKVPADLNIELDYFGEIGISSIHIYIYLFIYLYICLSIYLSTYIPTYLSTKLPTYQAT